MSDYCQGVLTETYAFVKLPKALFTDARFRGISIEAKILYAMMLDRIGISVKNCMFDDYGRVYVIFTFREIKEIFHCADHKANKILNELECKAGLIEKVGQGRGKPTLILIKNFLSVGASGKSNNHCENSRGKYCDNDSQSTAKSTDKVLPKVQTNNTNNKTNKKNNTSRSVWQIEEQDYDFEAIERDLLSN